MVSTTLPIPHVLLVGLVETLNLYAQSQVEIANLKQKVVELLDWQFSVMRILPDYQEIGHMMGLKPGEDVHDKIIPYIWELKREINNLQGLHKVNMECIAQLEAKIATLQNENGKGVTKEIEIKSKAIPTPLEELVMDACKCGITRAKVALKKTKRNYQEACKLIKEWQDRTPRSRKRAGRI